MNTEKVERGRRQRINQNKEESICAFRPHTICDVMKEDTTMTQITKKYYSQPVTVKGRREAIYVGPMPLGSCTENCSYTAEKSCCRFNISWAKTFSSVQ
jgi:hypothetical protein